MVYSGFIVLFTVCTGGQSDVLHAHELTNMLIGTHSTRRMRETVRASHVLLIAPHNGDSHRH